MNKLKTFTIEDIRSWRPCYSPKKYLPEDWKGNVIDILNLKECPFDDRLWVVLRNDFLSDKLMRLFSVWCARQVQHLTKDKRSIDALYVAERFANGEATKEELDAARAAAWAARAAAWAARAAADWGAANAALAAAGAASRATMGTSDDAKDSQEKKLREMIENGIKTGDSVCERNEG